MFVLTSQVPTHVAFSDESSYNQGRYRGLGLVTLNNSNLECTRADVADLVKDSGTEEIKWRKVKNARGRFAAIKLFDYALDAIRRGQFRIDVLTWDVYDHRHSVIGRDDMKNLHRMYYHLFRNVMKNRWPVDAVWHLYPDENNAMDWDSVGEILSNASTRMEIIDDLFSKGALKLSLKRDFRIEQIVPRQSHLEPLVQLADLFVGIGVYSRTSFGVFKEWNLAESSSETLFALSESDGSEIGGSDNERCSVLRKFEDTLRRHKLSVSLRSSKGLRTRNPTERLNFWWYEPQHEKDKAPTRTKRSGT